MVRCIIVSLGLMLGHMGEAQNLEQLAAKALILLDLEADADEKRVLLNEMPANMAFLNGQRLTAAALASALPMLQVVASSDSAFVLITGEARLDQEVYQYYGGIYLMRKRQWIPFSAEFIAPSPSITADTGGASQWQGKLYYHARKFRKRFRTYYVLMGYRYVDYFRREKTMEIMALRDGEPVFGMPAIMGPRGEELGRFSIEYAAEAPAFFNYDVKEKKFVFDNLVPFKGLYEGQGMVWVPDGSYSAFEYRQGYWQFIDKLPVQFSEAPPMERPVLNDRKKLDILGRPIEEKKR
jgi:hypothetical protein